MGRFFPADAGSGELEVDSKRFRVQALGSRHVARFTPRFFFDFFGRASRVTERTGFLVSVCETRSESWCALLIKHEDPQTPGPRNPKPLDPGIS